MPLKAIFLGSLGTLAETSELRRRAFNAAFAEAGLDWALSPNEHRRLAERRDCCAARIADYARSRGQSVDANSLQNRQNEIFRSLLGQVRMPPRPGLKRLIDAARVAGLDLALVTTEPPEEVEAMLAVTGFRRATFSFVGDAETVPAPKPAPDIYLAAMSSLSIAPQEAIAIEETPESAESARALGIQCVSFPGALHVGPTLRAVPDRNASTPRPVPDSRIARRA